LGYRHRFPSRKKLRGKLGYARARTAGELVFNNVGSPEENILGGALAKHQGAGVSGLELRDAARAERWPVMG